jgi:hypothetical protein
VIEAQGYHSESRRYDVGDDRPYVVSLVSAAN